MWLNHHYLMHYVVEVNPRLLWLNIALLFWMSLIPFATAWVGPHHLDPLPVGLYGFDLFCCGAAFALLRREVARQANHDPVLTAHHRAVQKKTILAACAYGSSVGLAFVSVYISEAILELIPLVYFLPERLTQPANSPKSSIQ